MSDYDLLRYAKQGIIIPLENLIDKYMPNLQAVFEKYPEIQDNVHRTRWTYLFLPMD